MIIPTTGIVHLFGAAVLIFLASRFYRYYKAENNYVAKLFSYSFFLIGLSYIFSGIPSLLLIKNQIIWRISVPVYTFLLIGGWLVLAYILAYTKFRKYTWLIVGPISIFFIAIVISFITHPPFYFFIDGSVNWEIESLLGLMMFPAVLLLIIPMGISFFQQARRAEDRRVKIRAVGLGLAICWMVIPVIFDFFLLSIFRVHPIYSDLTYFIFFLVLLVTVLLTWGRPQPAHRPKV